MAELIGCPPWLNDSWQHVLSRRQEQRLPHALLLTGVPGIGKRHFAQCIAQGLLCQAWPANVVNAEQTTTPTDHPVAPCGVCASCQQIVADAHPDYRHVVPEGASSSIKIDAVRQLVQWLQLTSSQGELKTAILESADSLNWHAANSLLKTLEEPSAGTLLLLTADRAAALPATIRSRCQTINLKLSDQAAAAHWLVNRGVEDADVKLAANPGMGPFDVLQQHTPEQEAIRLALHTAWLDLLLQRGSVGRIADSLADYAATECLATFASLTAAVIKYRQLGLEGSPAGGEISAPVDSATDTNSIIPLISLVEPVATQLHSEQWFTLYDRILHLHRSDTASIKTKGVLEGLFADIRVMTNG